MPSLHNAYEYSQEKDSCGIEFELCLANEAVKKASGKGYLPHLATIYQIWTLCISNDCSTIRDIP